jgi:hypothetical protein
MPLVELVRSHGLSTLPHRPAFSGHEWSGSTSDLASCLGLRSTFIRGLDVKPLDTWILFAERFGDEAVGNVEIDCVGVGFGDDAKMAGVRLANRVEHSTSNAGSAMGLPGGDVKDHDVGVANAIADNAN